MSKVCSTCKDEKALTEFGSYKGKNDVIKTRAECKHCRVLREGKRNQNNRERHNKYNSKWKANNKEHVKAYQKDYVCFKRQNDKQFQLKADLVSHVRHLIYGDRKTLSCLKCSREQLRVWFEHQFEENMTWLECEAWQVDHVIPLSFFDLTQEHEYMLASHWTNIRPIKADDNREKSDSIEKDTIIQHISTIKTFLQQHNGYQTNIATCWWQRFELWYGKNAEDERDFESFLKWIIRNEIPQSEEDAQRLNGSG